MSGIAGILHAEGKPVDPATLLRMLRAMAHRGPDGSAIWHQGRVGLGHVVLRTLPEASSETLPHVDGDLSVTADVRLDNRDELIAVLGLADRSMSDAALIIAAYRHWGEDCPEHLLGDFAFALWDGRRDRLFCARDHFGVKPFYYHASAARFVFASEIKSLFALADVPRRIDESRIADYLLALVTDAESTLYADIQRLPPRHSLTITRAGSRLRAYWQLDPPPLRGGDLVEQFRELFTTAVRCRLRSAGPVGAMLSGGLDSSSIACAAAPIVAAEQGRPLPTLSLVFDKTPAWSERPFIEAVLERGGFDPTFTAADDYAPFADLDRILAEQDGVFLAPGLALTRQLYRAAHDRGIRVLLNGHGGDEVVSHGWGRLHELALANRWLALWGEARGVAKLHGDSAWGVFATYLGRYGPGRHLATLRRSVARGLGRRGDARPAWNRSVHPDLVARSDIAARYRAHRLAEREAIGSERGRHTWTLSSGLVSYAFEVLDRAAAAAGVEPRYPFYDKRLVEFCVALPSEEKLSGGWSRLILRRAMEGVLPAAVQWRTDKLDFAPHIIRGMLTHHRALLDRVILDDADGVGAYVNLPVVAAAYRRIAEQAEAANGKDVQLVWRVAVLALWLRQLKATPAGTAAAA